MSHQQFHSEVQQWAELEAEGQAEAEWRKKEDEELARQESEESRLPWVVCGKDGRMGVGCTLDEAIADLELK